MGAIEATDQGVLIRVKAVPGARSDQIAGLLGERVKIRISAPPEGGKANRAIAALLAKALSVRERDVTLVSGPTSPEKTFEIAGVDAAHTAAALGITPG